MVLFSVNTCQYRHQTYFSCAVNSIIDLFHYTFLPFVKSIVSGELCCSSNTDFVPGAFLNALLDCYQSRLQCITNFSVSECRENVWNFLVANDAIHFAPKGRNDASVHNVAHFFMHKST